MYFLFYYSDFSIFFSFQIVITNVDDDDSSFDIVLCFVFFCFFLLL